MDPLDENLWGPAPTREEARATATELRRLARTARRRLVARSISEELAARRLGISMQAVSEHLAAGDLVGLKDKHGWHLPLWQFDGRLDAGFIPGLSRVLRYFPSGAVSLTRWATRPSPDLDGRTPRDALAAGDVDRVVDIAATLTAAGW